MKAPDKVSPAAGGAPEKTLLAGENEANAESAAPAGGAENGAEESLPPEKTTAQKPLSKRRRAALAVRHFFKSSVVLIVALVAAGITCFFVPFDREYLGYFDLQTLSCLFCTLAVVAAFKNIRFFEWLADIIVRRFRNMRNIV